VEGVVTTVVKGAVNGVDSVARGVETVGVKVVVKEVAGDAQPENPSTAAANNAAIDILLILKHTDHLVLS
jgi:hypothetical protein